MKSSIPQFLSDFVRSEGAGGVHYRLPDHARLFLLAWWLVSAVGCLQVWFFCGMPRQFPLVVLVPIGAVLLFSLIFLCGPLGWYLFQGRGEILVAVDTLIARQKAGPFWCTRSVPLHDLRYLFLVVPTVDPVRLFACTGRRRLALSWGEPAALLRRLLADLAAECNRRRQALGLPPLQIIEAEEPRFSLDFSPRTVYLCDGRLVVEGRFGLFRRRRWHPLDDLQRLTLVELGQRVRLAAVSRGHPPLMPAPLGEREALTAWARQLADRCSRATGREVPLTVEALPPQPDRPLQSIYSEVWEGRKNGRRLFIVRSNFVRILLGEDELTVEQPFLFFLRTTRRWFAREIRDVTNVTIPGTSGEGGQQPDSYAMQIVPWEGKPFLVFCRQLKDCEWLATVLRRWLYPTIEAGRELGSPGAASEAIRVCDERLNPAPVDVRPPPR
jgi:hypothetical protein